MSKTCASHGGPACPWPERAEPNEWGSGGMIPPGRSVISQQNPPKLNPKNPEIEDQGSLRVWSYPFRQKSGVFDQILVRQGERGAHRGRGRDAPGERHLDREAAPGLREALYLTPVSWTQRRSNTRLAIPAL